MVTTKCEPQLGKRNLYPNLSRKGINNRLKIRKDLLAYSNGRNSIFDIAIIMKTPLSNLTKELKLLMNEKLIKDKDN